MPGNLRSLSLLAVAAAASLAAAHPGRGQDRKIDYVIVGGGPAGFVLAEQLSRDRRTQVVLLEAGADAIDSQIVNTPAYYPMIHEHFWNYTSQPDPNLGGRAVSLGQGRLFGGGSGVNGMAYCRGAASVFDEWAEVSGNPGLAWESLLEDFMATTHYEHQSAGYDQFVNTTVYGDGPLEVSRTSGLTGFDLPFSRGVQNAMGLHEVDMTDGTGIGIDRGLQTIRVSNRTRSYPRNTFGLLMEKRRNVRVINNAWVKKVGFSGKVATSVTYRNILKNRTYTLKPKEIIISAGAINSPKLLMLSGIGPKDQLKNLGIPVVADIPAIGSNLYDHHMAIIMVQVPDDVQTLWQWSQNATAKTLYEEQYAANASGPLGWCNGLVAGSFRLPDEAFEGVNDTHYASLPADRPHVLIEYSTVPFDPNTPNVSAVTGWTSLMQPEAPGYVTLKSSDYRDDPIIYSNYFGSEADRAAIFWSYKKLREILQSNYLKSVVVRELYPGPEKTTDEELWIAIQNGAYSFRHPVGTVALGKALNSDWRLKGLKGIRVVDSSTFPRPPTCHPQASVYALAHRAAKDIRKADRKGHRDD